jgi:glyoxylase-like metal-dependent hydrolase (beta-lactamase superfamily II)
VKCDLTSTAVLAGGALVLIDPIRLAESALDELIGKGDPALIVCTNANHARAADFYRKKFGIPIAVHRDAAGEIEINADRLLADEDSALAILGQTSGTDWQVCALPGAAPGEMALVSSTGIVCIGDALIHLPSHGFSFLPDKYCTDTKLLRASLQKLLRWDFHILTFAHGLPLVTQARARLEALLA